MSSPAHSARAVAGALTMALTLACGRDAPPPEAVVVDTGPVVLAIDSVPLLEIPGSFNDQLVFSRLAGATRFDDGRLVLADALSHELIIVDTLGRVAHRTGRRGAGPGEFESVSWMGRCGGDSLFVHDGVLARMSVFDAAGEYVRMFRLAVPSPALMTCSRDGVILAATAPPEAMVPPVEGAYPRMVGQVTLMNTMGDSIGALGEISLGRNRTLGTLTSFVVLPALIGVATAESMAVEFRSHDGAVRGRRDLGIDRVPATDSHLEAAIDQRAGRVPGGVDTESPVRQILRRSGVPALLPAYREAIHDEAGTIWLVTSAWGDPVTRFLGISADPSDTTRPRTFEVNREFTVHEIGPRHLLMGFEDEGGMPYVAVYRIGRDTTP